MQTSRSAIDPVTDIVLTKSAILPILPSVCYRLFTESDELESWLCEKANVEPRLGGSYELFWDHSDPENDSTIGCRITALESDRLLAFQWRSPKQFKSFANTSDPLTHVVVAFHEVSQGTMVTLVHSGWRSTDEWLAAAQWQSVAWDYAFKALTSRTEGANHGEA